MSGSEGQRLWAQANATLNIFSAMQTGMATLTKYANAFFIPFLISSSYFNRVERERFWKRTPQENFLAYLKLGQMNLDMMDRAFRGSYQATDQFIQNECLKVLSSLAQGDFGEYQQFALKMVKMVKGVAFTYPEAIDNIKGEFGFHFERQPADTKVAETSRFELYQVLPTDPRIDIRRDGKPLLIIPPFVLGANILSFLPGDKRSYAHAFADQGIPTYVRILKNIQTAEAVQVMTPEDDALDTRLFCETIKKRHGAAVTLNGYCQGGYAALCDILSGALDGLVDAFITCVAPMDGTRSSGLAQFLKNLPPAFNDLSYGTKLLANGNQVADGTLMGWVYKLKSIEAESPPLAMWRDMMLVARINGAPPAISKTAAALNYWLLYERNDLPMEITRMSFAAYNTPITPDGRLPVKLFGRTLNLKRLKAKNLPWLICYGLHDDLVEPETALAPLDHVDAQTTPFPKGHVAIATSWSHPDSAYALHTCHPKGNARGPVCFQLDLQKERDAARKPAKVKTRGPKDATANQKNTNTRNPMAKK